MKTVKPSTARKGAKKLPRQAAATQPAPVLTPAQKLKAACEAQWADRDMAQQSARAIWHGDAESLRSQSGAPFNVPFNIDNLKRLWRRKGWTNGPAAPASIDGKPYVSKATIAGYKDIAPRNWRALVAGYGATEPGMDWLPGLPTAAQWDEARQAAWAQEAETAAPETSDGPPATAHVDAWNRAFYLDTLRADCPHGAPADAHIEAWLLHIDAIVWAPEAPAACKPALAETDTQAALAQLFARYSPSERLRAVSKFVAHVWGAPHKDPEKLAAWTLAQLAEQDARMAA